MANARRRRPHFESSTLCWPVRQLRFSHKKLNNKNKTKQNTHHHRQHHHHHQINIIIIIIINIISTPLKG